MDDSLECNLCLVFPNRLNEKMDETEKVLSLCDRCLVEPF